LPHKVYDARGPQWRPPFFLRQFRSMVVEIHEE
jgi:hypothetical protein